MNIYKPRQCSEMLENLDSSKMPGMALSVLFHFQVIKLGSLQKIFRAFLISNDQNFCCPGSKKYVLNFLN